MPLVIAALMTSPALAERPLYLKSEMTAGLPFSDAVRHNGVLYLSGQIPATPDGTLAKGGMAAQARQVMDNIRATVEKYGSGMDRIIKCTVFLSDMDQWAEFNKVYVTYFDKGRLPARSAVEVSGLAMGALMEVECLAAMDDD
ncbi:RidA family protein [Luteithermobacter gelatinilyticus]|uniref:RidA family protein n=1 Tax=Luteithermobacter gelatinilyticus TaxID=2582913 RepID=UPI001AF01BA2|nr:RidA family protein [Luteithermobacter gelatinilyticus]